MFNQFFNKLMITAGAGSISYFLTKKLLAQLDKGKRVEKNDNQLYVDGKLVTAANAIIVKPIEKKPSRSCESLGNELRMFVGWNLSKKTLSELSFFELSAYSSESYYSRYMGGIHREFKEKNCGKSTNDKTAKELRFETCETLSSTLRDLMGSPHYNRTTIREKGPLLFSVNKNTPSNSEQKKFDEYHAAFMYRDCGKR